MKKIIFTRPSDGGVSVIHPVINTHPVRENITEDEALERAKKDIPPDALDVLIVDESEIPADRTFREAWRNVNGIQIDMDRCRTLKRNTLRELRTPKFKELDCAYFKAEVAKFTRVVKEARIPQQE